MGVYIKGMEMPKNLGVSVTIYPDGRVIRYLGYGAKEQLGTAAPSRRMGGLEIWTCSLRRLSTSDFTIRIPMVWLHGTM